MTDREKAIKGLEIHTNMYASCKDCPYWDGVGHGCHNLWGDTLKVLKAQPKWIPVKEKLPDKEGRYLVCDGGDVLEACFSPTGQLRRNQNGGFDRLPSWSTTDCYESEDLDHVTHWMPLPEPPEGE